MARAKKNNLARFNKRRAASNAAWAGGGAVQVDIGGINQIAVDLTQAANDIAPAASMVVRKAALDTVAEAKTFCVVDTGYLRSSIGMTMDGDGLGAEVGPAAAYGAYVELGTSRMAPRAFLGPAFDRQQPMFMSALDQLIGDVL